MNEKVDNLATERQPTPITIELWTHAELAAMKSVIRSGLYTMQKHDETTRESIVELADECGVKNYETVAEAWYKALDRFREFAGEGDY